MIEQVVPRGAVGLPRSPSTRTLPYMTERDPARILVADDQPDILQALKLLLKSEGYQIVTATSPAQISAAIGEQPVDVILMDMNYARDTTSGKEGLDLLARIHAVHPNLPVVV